MLFCMDSTTEVLGVFGEHQHDDRDTQGIQQEYPNVPDWHYPILLWICIPGLESILEV